MSVIGTAGHVDHGKSSLVRALTGIDPDRLKEEKAREMTIDLGFAWLELPGKSPIGIVDVPGHRDFIENMLAGVGGIDAVLFVVAADEGVMPQTREHLAIIDLLRIPAGLVALTKTDLIPDPDWLDLVRLDLEDALRGTMLEGAPTVPVSVRTGQGIGELRDQIVSLLDHRPTRPDLSQPRLWVDRVFSVSGFGTVVTGTLLDGTLELGQEIEIQPGGTRGRVRGLQSHHSPLQKAHPGNRIAVNIAGIDKSDVRRGNLLSMPGAVIPTTLAAVRFRHLPDMPRPLKHNAEVKLFCGSAETVARVRLLDSDSLAPGAEGWVQIELRDPTPLAKGDRFILRYPSPGETIGGGEVIVAAPGQRWRRNRPEVIARLEAVALGDPEQMVSNALGKPQTVATLVESLGLDRESVESALQAILARGEVARLGSDRWISLSALETLLERLTNALADAHRSEPLRPGLRPEKARAMINLDARDLSDLASVALERGLIARAGVGNACLCLPGHRAKWSRAQRAAIDRLSAAFASSPYAPPSPKEAAEMVGDAVLSALIEWGELRQVAPDVLFAPSAWAEIVAYVREQLAQESRITVKALRDRFDTSRKYALGALEHLNNLGITRRAGDDHVLASGDWTLVM